MDELIPASESKLFKEYLADMVHTTLELDVSITPKLKKAHRDHDFDWFYNMSNMLIAPSLDRIISADEPPPIEVIDTLPDLLAIDNKILRKYMTLYVLLVEKEGEQPRLGIGTAASQAQGSAPRVGHYRNETIYMLSRFTKQSMDEGFKISRLCVLLVVPLPQNQDARPLMRAWILTLEASFTWTFWSV